MICVKFIYSEKATKFCEIFPLLLTTVHTVKCKGKISQYFVAFSEYMNFTESLGRKCWIQESNLSLPHTTSSSCVTWSWPVRYFRSTHCLGWAIGMWKIDLHSTFTTLLWSQKWRIGKHFLTQPKNRTEIMPAMPVNYLFFIWFFWY